MGQNYCQTALTCPKCGEKAVFIRSRIIKVDGETVGIVSPKCDRCGWEPTEEEAINDYKEWLRECEELQEEEDEG